MSQKRRPSSARWLAEHKADTYVQEARRLGYRSRAVFKLKEIQEKDRILKQGQVVVDLGAAPGGWSQLARPLLGPSGRLLALEFCLLQLKPGGHALMKVFQGEGSDDFLRKLRQAFESVTIRKPKASRARSKEIYVLARSLRQV